MKSYRRILLKLSGEALAGAQGYGIQADALLSMASSVKDACDSGAQVGVVLGGGNIFRGIQAGPGQNRARADSMGMLATVINALAMQEALEGLGVQAHVMSAIEMPRVAETFVREQAVAHLEAGRVVIFAGGTGNPYFTTDSAAALRALEIGADVLIKATKVNGVYDKDPLKHADAHFFPELDFDEALTRNLGVMDLTAITLCRDNNLEIRVINIKEPGSVRKLLEGEPVGSIVRRRQA
ncbi:MAG TPA: UMP kinase [Deltaproteobacteria bacterium]|nr:UMP kinase [Deltaproteobacteria bacterium]